MNLLEIKKILEDNGILIESKIEDKNIQGITYDSREVKKDYLFFCKGKNFKVEYLTKSIENGASLYVSEEKFDNDTDFFLVSDIRKAMAVISSAFYQEAYKDIEIIGITGTKGKTTVTYFIKNIIDEFTKKKSAVISTVEVYTGARCEEAHLTTPEAPLLHKLFSEVKENKLKYLTMEVTSQAYKTLRVDGVHFSHGMFLNIAEDHISDAEHRDFSDYLNCKLELIKNSDDMLINRDMEYYNVVKDECEKNNVKYTTYGKIKGSDYLYSNIRKCENGFEFNVKSKNFDEKFVITMPGRFNVENAVAAIAMCSELGVDVESIKKGILNTTVMGRMNVFEKNGFTVIVDYAHNNLSFTKLYESIKLDYPNRNIISLGGGPGGKAYKRREDFGKIVGGNSDFIVLTAEDPQFEEVEDICNDIAKYLPDDCNYVIIPDRAVAIEKIITNAKDGDVIILLAKSEEEYQKVKGVFTYYESDLKITKRMLGL